MITLEVKEQDEIGLSVNGSTMPMPDEYCIGGSLLDRTVTGYYCKRGITEITTNTGLNFQNELETVDVPDTVELLGGSCFSHDPKLKLKKLPSSLRTIQAAVFNSCFALDIDEIPANVETIGATAFERCEGINRLVFKGTPSTINRTAFSRCVNITDIFVPWAEGEVENAPWGATNATIHYGYQGE